MNSVERLTKYGKTIHENGVCCTHFMSKECHEVLGNCAYGCKWEEEAWSKLAKYEDLEEQGLLLRLPCKVGDKIYHIEDGDMYDFKVDSIEVRKENGKYIFYISFMDYKAEDFGRIVFLTKAEAEKKLAEMGE